MQVLYCTRPTELKGRRHEHLRSHSRTGRCRAGRCCFHRRSLRTPLEDGEVRMGRRDGVVAIRRGAHLCWRPIRARALRPMSETASAPRLTGAEVAIGRPSADVVIRVVVSLR